MKINSYLEAGWEVIPLIPSTKKPIQKKWNLKWNRASCVAIFKSNPKANVGLKLGQIIDVEGDTPEANKILEEIIGNYPHPFYRSNRSTHHLFLNPKNISLLKKDGIEFRGFNHQSVLPPSVVNEEYIWITDNNLIVPTMPEALLSLCKSLYKPTVSKKQSCNYSGSFSWKEQVENPKLSKNKFLKPNRTLKMCASCKEYFPIHKKRFKKEAEAFERYGYKWTCKDCAEFTPKVGA